MGKPILVLALLAAVSGLAVLVQPAKPRAQFVVWVYTQDDADTFRRLAPSDVQVELLAQRALDARLMSLFMSDHPVGVVPDLVEIDLGSVGKYFRPPAADVGLVPLNDFLSKNDLLPERLAPWSKSGLIFGVPRDVHPVTITYRKDLFDEAGTDLSAAHTWPQFQEACLRFQQYWSAHGQPNRMAMELYSAQSEELLLMLLQRRINLVDESGAIHIAGPLVARTLAFYAQLVAGPRRIAADTIAGTPFGYRQMADGDVCAMFTPDWRAPYLKEYAPELSGKVRMIRLPIFDAGDAPTSTWGGTMIGIPRMARDPAASWKLLEKLCLTREAIQARREFSDIIPPTPREWNDPAYSNGDAYFGGQPIDRLYIELAGQIPARYATPLSITAQAALSVVLNRAVNFAKDHGDDGLEPACAAGLTEAAAELEQWAKYGDFGP